jgi:predicted deacetylase
VPHDSLLLASIHDVSPRFESEIDQLVAMMEPFVGSRLAMLVVPNNWGEAPIVAGSRFAARLRAWSDAGIELFLHGYFHRDEARHSDGADRLKARYLTAGEGEFLGLSRVEAARRIVAGRDLIEQISGRPIAGFVAPAWLYGREALEALHECGMALAEDHWRVWSPASERCLARGPVITWASRTPLRLASSLAAARVLRTLPLRTLRVGVHPPDTRHPVLMRSIEETLRVAMRSRRAGSYSELAPRTSGRT